MRRVGNFTLFFGAEDAFSNWHPCRFTYHDVAFRSVEQFMMFSKAKLLGDEDIAQAVLATHLPKEQKALGRKVKGFDLDVWKAKRESIVYVGCREKFAQHTGLRTLLLATAPTELVEASPYDTIWGVGLGEHHPDIMDRSKWRGQNLLGKALMKVRDTLSVQLHE
ncbi:MULTISPECIES: NADAR family protein [unclassified Caballeronia]|uniref:NADAR family protein n=1 Tax=unclassified Caballeronia TaxID=2646786 RepID=UPI00285440B6|nr:MULTISPECIES: NADAR family protein [unclassified Caballeronia]MDR5777117.1 NADAR family protein [Caballeronia sp. LZ002]MDR5798728.1 NADAR family protein [Caballeronia sp. LZ001]MDR5852550.1 NADAR family protein [Caballeronia sp. LZ003]